MTIGRDQDIPSPRDTTATAAPTIPPDAILISVEQQEAEALARAEAAPRPTVMEIDPRPLRLISQAAANMIRDECGDDLKWADPYAAERLDMTLTRLGLKLKSRPVTHCSACFHPAHLISGCGSCNCGRQPARYVPSEPAAIPYAGPQALESIRRFNAGQEAGEAERQETLRRIFARQVEADARSRDPRPDPMPEGAP